MNASTTRHPATAATRAGRGSFAPASPAPGPFAAPAAVPFAALPHDIAADPRLTPVDVRVLLALLFYARSRAACWPSDATIGSRVGRSVSTVQRALRRLHALGLVERVPDDTNRTGRRIVLAWRGRPTPASAMTDPPASRMTDEGRREGEGERPESAAGFASPPPPAGDEGREPDLATLHQWAEGTDPILRRIAGRRLAELTAGVAAVAGGAMATGPVAATDPGPTAAMAVESPVPVPAPAPPAEPPLPVKAGGAPPASSARPASSSPSVPGRPAPVAGRRPGRPGVITPPGEPEGPGPRRPAMASRRARGPRGILEGPGPVPATPAAWAARRMT